MFSQSSPASGGKSTTTEPDRHSALWNPHDRSAARPPANFFSVPSWSTIGGEAAETLAGGFQGGIKAESMTRPTQIAVFGGGCFWCTEAVFEQVTGVIAVMPGYAGGPLANPTYEAVCGGKTGHAEVIRIEFDPAQVSYRDLLTVFFATHDPTTPNRQGHDAGTQYRSIILYANDTQKQHAQAVIEELDRKGIFGQPIVTEVKPLREFYDAEPYHQKYYSNNPGQPYCFIVINPKLEKLKSHFRKMLKEQSGTAAV